MTPYKVAKESIKEAQKWLGNIENQNGYLNDKVEFCLYCGSSTHKLVKHYKQSYIDILVSVNKIIYERLDTMVRENGIFEQNAPHSKSSIMELKNIVSIIQSQIDKIKEL